MSIPRLANLIDGRLQAPHHDAWLEVHEPATGAVFAHCPDSSATDVAAAVAAAGRAAPGWAGTPIEQRAHLLQRLADLVEARLEEFAALESRDSGKPLSLARRLDIPRAVSNLRYFAAAIIGWGSESHAMEAGGMGTGAINYTLRQPLGVVGCISPWNLPLYLFTWKIAPALAAGNAVVAKPSEVTPCTAALLGELAVEADPTQNVYLVPAFVGLGAPYWDADARGAVFGLTRNSGPAEFARAALESVAYQTRDLLDAMKKDWKGGSSKTVLRVDGGMVASDWTMQRLADILDAPVDRPTILETTALGAAWLAGSKAGLWPKAPAFAKAWALDRRFSPAMDAKTRAAGLKGWRDAVRRTLSTN